ncbi:MAG TPA: nodulation protein NfeD [Myxococcota bacterium]|nr:nodulation protein NfeD [Myxococcota bacterium]
MSRTLWAAALAAALLLSAGGAAAAGHVNEIRIKGTINPASSDFIQKAIVQSEAEDAAALLIQLDTPGGLVTATKDIIQAMLNAKVPVIVYVAPQGAWAGSAGTFITLAGHVAAMAPGTSIGAAHPVGIGAPGGGGKEGEEGGRDVAGEKAENLLAAFIESIARERERNVEWAVKAVRESLAIPADEALRLKVIDLVAANRDELLDAADGRQVKVEGTLRPLAVRDAEVRPIEMSALERFLHVLASPDVAVLLLMAGMLGLYIEFSNPGLLVPGVAGAACMVLGLIALQILPFSWLGLIVFLAGLGLLAAEVFVGSYGVLFALGIACLLLGGSMIFDVPEVSDLGVSFWSVLVPAVTGMALFGALVVFGVGRTLGRRQTAGVDELIGLVGRAVEPLSPEGRVFVRGEYWSVRADEPVAAGERVEVTGVEGMRLRVRRARVAAEEGR